MPHRPLRVALVGAGMITAYHRQALIACADAGIELAALAHPEPERITPTANSYGVPCRTVDDVLADPGIDIVSICTPSGLHAGQALAAIEAGKHVLVEKPMALSLSSADAMIEAAEARGVCLAVALQRRVTPLFQRIKAAIDAGDLGRLTLGLVTLPYLRDMAYYNQASWRGTWTLDGGGVLMNQGIHLIDLLIWFMGDPVMIQAQADTLVRDIEVEDVASAVLRFENGAMATVAATTAAGGGFPHRIEVYGTDGGVQIEGEGVVRWALTHADATPAEPTGVTHAGAGGDPRAISADGHTALFRDLAVAIREGRAPVVDGREGRRSLATVLGIYEAAGLL